MPSRPFADRWKREYGTTIPNNAVSILPSLHTDVVPSYLVSEALAVQFTEVLDTVFTIRIAVAWVQPEAGSPLEPGLFSSLPPLHCSSR